MSSRIMLSETQAIAFRKAFNMEPDSKMVYMVPETPAMAAALKDYDEKHTIVSSFGQVVEVDDTVADDTRAPDVPTQDVRDENFIFIHGFGAKCLKPNSYESQAITLLETKFPNNSVISRKQIYMHLRLLWTVAGGHVCRGETMVTTLVGRHALIRTP